LGCRVFFFSESSTSKNFSGAVSVPSSSSRTWAPRRGGRTKVFQNRKFALVSLVEGGLPRTAASAIDEEDEAMAPNREISDQGIVRTSDLEIVNFRSGDRGLPI
jgi:hypothetical protein